MDFNSSAALFKALADPHRLRILQLLAIPPATSCAAAGSVCACDFEPLLGLSQPTISHHLRLLEKAGLITATRRGKWMNYALNPEGFEQARMLLAELHLPVPHLPPTHAKGERL